MSGVRGERDVTYAKKTEVNQSRYKTKTKAKTVMKMKFKRATLRGFWHRRHSPYTMSHATIPC